MCLIIISYQSHQKPVKSCLVFPDVTGYITGYTKNTRAERCFKRVFAQDVTFCGANQRRSDTTGLSRGARESLWRLSDMADIDTGLSRYRVMKPPKFKESELRAFLIEQHDTQPTAPLPTVRALRAKFGGGSTRILRIRRTVAAELGVRPTDDLALRSRVVVDRLERVCERLKATTREPATGTAVVIPFPTRGPAPDSSDPLLRRIAVELADVASRIRSQHDRSETNRSLAAIQDRLETLQQAVDALRSRIDQPAPPLAHTDASIASRLESLQDGQLALAQRLGDLRRDAAQREARMETLADRIEATTGTIASEVAVARDATLGRLESATNALAAAASRGIEIQEAVRITALETLQRVREEAGDVHDAAGRDLTAILEGRLADMGQQLATAQSEATARTVAAVAAVVEPLGAHVTATVAAMNRSVQSQRRAADRVAARITERLGDVATSIEALGHKRPPRAVRLHAESLSAIEAAIARRVAVRTPPRRRKPTATANASRTKSAKAKEPTRTGRRARAAPSPSARARRTVSSNRGGNLTKAKRPRSIAAPARARRSPRQKARRAK
jgi:hypothetical protein